jgi:hypothetical protein
MPRRRWPELADLISLSTISSGGVPDIMLWAPPGRRRSSLGLRPFRSRPELARVIGDAAPTMSRAPGKITPRPALASPSGGCAQRVRSGAPRRPPRSRLYPPRGHSVRLLGCSRGPAVTQWAPPSAASDPACEVPPPAGSQRLLGPPSTVVASRDFVRHGSEQVVGLLAPEATACGGGCPSRTIGQVRRFKRTWMGTYHPSRPSRGRSASATGRCSRCER